MKHDDMTVPEYLAAHVQEVKDRFLFFIEMGQTIGTPEAWALTRSLINQDAEADDVARDAFLATCAKAQAWVPSVVTYRFGLLDGTSESYGQL